MGWRRPGSSKALKAQELVDEVEPVRPGRFVLVQAAGAGVSQMLARMARRKGGIVICTAGCSEKAAIALAARCNEGVLYRD